MSKSIESNKQFMLGNGLLAFGVFFIVFLFLYLGFRSEKKITTEQSFKDIYIINVTENFAGDSINIFINDSLLLAKKMDNSNIKFQINRFAEENMLMVVDCKTDLISPFNLSKEGGELSIDKKNGKIFFMYTENKK